MIDIQNQDCFDYLKTIESEWIDTICIDPPYDILQHKIETGIDIELLITECKRVLKEKGFFIVFGMMPTIHEWHSELLKQNFIFKKEVIWQKLHTFSPSAKILPCHENIYIYTKNNKNNFQDVQLSYDQQSFHDILTVQRHVGYLKQVINKMKIGKSYEEAIKALYIKKKTRAYNNDDVHAKVLCREKYLRIGGIMNTGLPKSVIYFPQHNQQGYGKSEYNIKHPTVKPIQLVKLLLQLTCETNAKK